jgi:hypothetical protein
VLVEGLIPGLPAAKCNIQLGSVVTAINDHSLKGMDFEEMPRLMARGKLPSGPKSQQPTKLVKVAMRQPVMVSQILELTQTAERCLQKLEAELAQRTGLMRHQEQEQDLSGFDTIYEDTEAEALEAEELRQEQENYLRQIEQQQPKGTQRQGQEGEDAEPHGEHGPRGSLGERVVL